MSRGQSGPRGAAAGIALAAAGMIYSRLTGRRAQPHGLGEPPLDGDKAPSDEVEQARSELADELARLSGQGDRSASR